ncbi:anti-sigma factor antagonist [Streptomyces sp. NPDC057757]|uniref:anti-sigma factor antagonist n=1 Tax=Streptomyces sp. NPDC057757 TaxID=3346241 RepID=UPI0036A9130A
MSLLTYRVGSCLVVELDEVIDPDIEDTVEGVLESLVRSEVAPVVVVDLRTPLLTSTAVQMLSRVRRTAQIQGSALCVVARHPLARHVLRTAGLTRTLRVATTISGAVALARGCPPAHQPATHPPVVAGRPAPVRRAIGRLLFR